jgi:hypothetical protein
MRGMFFLWLLFGLIALAVLYFLFLVAKSFVVIAQDIWTNRELTKLADEYSDRRKRLKTEAVARLQNGCEHQYDDQAGALPGNVCCRCGLSKEKPPGDCDHVWRVLPGIIPRSQCEKCNQEFSSVPI